MDELVKQLSVVVVNWNTRDLLKQCLTSLYESAFSRELEVLVVDNASSDGSGQMVKKDFPEVQLIANETNLGFAKASNQGVKESGGKFILLLNSDIKMLPGVLDTMTSFMEQHPEVGILGPKLVYPNGSYQLSGGHFPTILSELSERAKLTRLFPWSKFVGKYRMNYWKRDGERELDWVSGAALMIERKMVDDVGLMDGNFFMHYEDIDWCYRAKQKGWKVSFLPQAQFVHLERQSTKKYPTGRHFLNYRQSQFYFYQKHYGMGEVIALRVVTVLIMMLRIIFLPVEYLVARDSQRGFLQRLRLYWTVVKMAFRKEERAVADEQAVS